MKETIDKCIGKFVSVASVNWEKVEGGMNLLQHMQEVTIFEKDGKLGMSVSALEPEKILDAKNK